MLIFDKKNGLLGPWWIWLIFISAIFLFLSFKKCDTKTIGLSIDKEGKSLEPQSYFKCAVKDTKFWVGILILFVLLGIFIKKQLIT